MAAGDGFTQTRAHLLADACNAWSTGSDVLGMKPLLFHDELIWLVVLPEGKAKSEVWRRRRIWGFIRHELGTDFGPERVRGAAGAEQRRLKDSVVGFHRFSVRQKKERLRVEVAEAAFSLS